MKRIKKTLTLVSMAVLLLTACEAPKELGVVPYPQYAQTTSKTVELPSTVTFSTNLAKSDMNDLLAYLPDFAIPMKLVDKNPFVTIEITDATDNPIAAEGYNLTVSKQGVNIQASSAAGAFYGLQTLAQLARNGKELPVTTIKDEPRFPYRGLHLDVSRHFFNTDYVKKQIDLVATYKINRLHWHLTDGAGWRLEIPGYPRLTEFAAWRKAANLQDWGKYDHHFCEKDEEGAYGGYYTEADVREVLEYARLRHVTVIPEIEMPGHSGEVLAAYPQLSCTGKPYTSGEVCIGNEETFKFFEDVLDEVIRLFPSRYIHIGGDEASRRHWKACPKCQKRMKEEGLKDESELQSYMIVRIEKYLNDKGREIIGWDEILDGGLAPNATVMSWRGEEGGIAAVTSGHRAIMTPGAYCYLDSYQDAPYSQPEAIGGYLPLKKVYSYNPVPASLTAEQAKLVYGVQGNLWVEYIPTPEHVEYMIYPRILALAETAWSAPERKSWPDFHTRALSAVADLQAKGYHPFDLSKEIGSRPESLQPVSHLALGKKVTYNSSYSPHYPAQGNTALTDGIRGDWTYGDGSWQGFISDNRLDVTIDMEKETSIHSVTAAFMQVVGAEVFLPETVIISISDDGINFTELQKQHFEVSKETPIRFTDISWQGEAKGRYVRYQAQAGSEFGGWIFTDEIIVK